MRPAARKIALILSLLVGALFGAVTGIRALVNSLPLPSFTFLIAGTDQDLGGGQRADSIVTGWVRPNGSIALLSIPRDTLAQIPGVGQSRINHAFVVGGPELLRRAVEGLLGVRLEQVAVVDLKLLEQVVDILGGIEIEVKEPMFYRDQAAGLTIDLRPGRQVLDGAQLAGFVRYRNTPGADLDRIDRQKRAVAAIVNRAIVESSPATLARLLAVTAGIPGNLDTALLARWADRWRAGLAWNWITLETSPVDNGGDPTAPAYQAATRDAVAAAVEATFGEQALIGAAHLSARALVLDATGQSGPDSPGERAADLLKRLGWRVEVRTARATATSLVEVRPNALRSGRLAAGLLGIHQVNGVSVATPGFDLAITFGGDQVGVRPRVTLIGSRDQVIELAVQLARKGWEVDPWFDEAPGRGTFSFRPSALAAVSRIANLLPGLAPELDHRLGADLVIRLPSHPER